MASSHHHSSSSVDRPERSRNAKAQARHRAKRKAYIEQLEQTVAKLQLTLGLPSEQLSVLPPPSIRIQELEAENARLEEENEQLRQALNGKNPNGAEDAPRSGLTGFASTREPRRRRGDDYIVRVRIVRARFLASRPPVQVPSIELGSPMNRMTPPSLSIPSTSHLGQPYSPHPMSTHASSSSSGYSLSGASQNPSPFQHTLPPTPSSGSSSPSFSASHSTRSPILTHPTSGFSSSHYGSQQQIKVEEDAYLVSLRSPCIPVRIFSPHLLLPCG
ncbi:hypothetical protein HDZ31DRAFT_82142 [Schizophyllum fasciatum]